ncbi:hypothetical protein ACLOJK_027551 [Asimina triloba]
MDFRVQFWWSLAKDLVMGFWRMVMAEAWQRDGSPAMRGSDDEFSILAMLEEKAAAIVLQARWFGFAGESGGRCLMSHPCIAVQHHPQSAPSPPLMSCLPHFLCLSLLLPPHHHSAVCRGLVVPSASANLFIVVIVVVVIVAVLVVIALSSSSFPASPFSFLARPLLPLPASLVRFPTPRHPFRFVSSLNLPGASLASLLRSLSPCFQCLTTSAQPPLSCPHVPLIETEGRNVDGRDIMVQFTKYGPNAKPM